MENLRLDRSALAEVYIILLMLPKEKLNKIPKELVEGIRCNREENYEIDMDKIEEEMLPDTEKILAAIYTYYLASGEEKNTIIQLIELEKKNKYKESDILKRETDLIIVDNESEEIIATKNNIFVRIKNWIKSIIRRFK